jgi:hypothetical protein
MVFESVEISTPAEESPAVSWAAIAAGAIAAAALTLVLLAFGAGMGFSAVSPWGNAGVSASKFQIGTGIYLIVVAMLASTIGGYIAGRMRTKWLDVHAHEVFFRDTAHGFLAWRYLLSLDSRENKLARNVPRLSRLIQERSFQKCHSGRSFSSFW